MPLAIDPSSPARVGGNATTAATAGFTPPAQSTLVAIAHANSDTTGTVTCVITNSVTGLTWEQTGAANFADGQPGGVFIAVAKCPNSITNTAVTATTTNNNSVAGDRYTSLRVFVVTGADQTDPTGAANEGTSTTNNLTTGAFVTTRANSMGFCGGTDWVAVAGTVVSSDMGSNGNGFSVDAVLNGYGGWKQLAGSGVSTTFNLDAPGTTGSQWTWTSVEILAALASTPPTVSAGVDLATVSTGGLVSILAAENDNGSAISARQWSIVSGPAGVGTTIGTTAQLWWFPPADGTYVLRYSATNSAGTTTDDVSVTSAAPVPDAPTPPMIWNIRPSR